MKTISYRNLLFILFFGLLLAAWGLDFIGVRPRSELERRADRVLTDLIDESEAAVRRVEIDRGDEHLVFERLGEGLSHWQMLQPKDVAAEPVRLDALVRNLKELRKDPDAGTIAKEQAEYGLATPAATIRLYGRYEKTAKPDVLVAELAVGSDAGEPPLRQGEGRRRDRRRRCQAPLGDRSAGRRLASAEHHGGADVPGRRGRDHPT